MYKFCGREVFWDMFLADENHGITIKNHTPVRKNIVLSLDAPWEGEHGGYISLIKDGDMYKLYYRGGGYNDGPEKVDSGYHSVICVAESRDGKVFTKPNVGIFEYNGSKDNNIVHAPGVPVDNFTVFYDENPNCPEDERYKALSSTYPGSEGKLGLGYFKSGDGYHFEFVRVLPFVGTFDSMNVGLWDPTTKKYCIYFRNFHSHDNVDYPECEFDEKLLIRDVRLAQSDDFVTWTNSKRIQYTDGREDIQYYTSGITKYHRANYYFGTPVRYIDRASDAVNYKYLPKLSGFRERLIQREGRGGTAVTDCTAIFSRDGYMFERSGEAFCTPGIENNENWIYGDCYFGRGLFETESDYPFEPNEMSFYKCHGYRHRPVDVVRYTLRLDGFRSWHADKDGGYILTKPISLCGDSMTVNFATSALGSLRIIICDKDGTPIPGYDSTSLFGDSIERPVDFEKPLSELCGKEVRLRIEMSECDFWSMNIL